MLQLLYPPRRNSPKLHFRHSNLSKFVSENPLLFLAISKYQQTLDCIESYKIPNETGSASIVGKRSSHNQEERHHVFIVNGQYDAIIQFSATPSKWSFFPRKHTVFQSRDRCRHNSRFHIEEASRNIAIRWYTPSGDTPLKSDRDEISDNRPARMTQARHARDCRLPT